jgi:hypothetical protein
LGDWICLRKVVGYIARAFYARLTEMMQEIHPGLTGCMMKEMYKF